MGVEPLDPADPTSIRDLAAGRDLHRRPGRRRPRRQHRAGRRTAPRRIPAQRPGRRWVIPGAGSPP